MKNLNHHRRHQSSSTRQNDCKTAIVILSAGAHINACAILFFLPVSGVLDLTCFTFSGVTHARKARAKFLQPRPKNVDHTP